ncbi:MAG TPA: hypothetical protein VHD83_28715 [Puia sp.]|nr:hypothetical protein [Puia sp.]
MNELFGQTNEGPSMEGEILKALVGKVVELAAAVKENAELTKKLVENVEELRDVKERMAGQEKRVEELIRKEAEVTEAIQQAAEKMNLPVEKVEQLQGTLDQQIKSFERPLDKTVRHHHFIGKAFWILLGMVWISSGVAAMMIWQWRRADQYAAGQMKYRYIKLIADAAIMKIVDQVDSTSRDDPKGFAKGVEAEEDRREELIKNMLKEQEARRRIDELEKQKAKK